MDVQNGLRASCASPVVSVCARAGVEFRDLHWLQFREWDGSKPRIDVNVDELFVALEGFSLRCLV
jgi:hypothetical protein